jgi:hypothetical protein
MINLQPTLQNNLILLQPISVLDFDNLFLLAQDKLIWQQHPEPDRFKKEVFENYFNSAIESKGAFIIVNKSNNQTIGSTRFYNYQTTTKSIAIGFTFLARQYWGGHYNQRFKDIMIYYIFIFVDVVFLLVGNNILWSALAVKKIGGVISNNDVTNDNEKNFCFEITKQNWNSKLFYKINPLQ